MIGGYSTGCRLFCCYNSIMISDKQKKILAFPYSRYDALICDGAIRSGKTSLMTVSYIRDAMERFNNQDFIILGNSVESATRNVIEPYKRLGYANKRYKLNYNRGRHILTVKNDVVENRFHVFGANNERSYEPIQGMTAAGCMVDEVAICNRKAVETATARCSVDGSLLWFNCNPSYPTHWFREEWILGAKEKNALYLHFMMDDNPSLSDKIKERFKRQYSGVFNDRYIKGLWVVAEGLIYQFDSQEEYTCTDKEAQGIYVNSKGEEVKDGGRYFISIDYGITNPFAALLWRIYKGKAYCVSEYYFNSKKENRKKTDSELYQGLENLADGYNIEAIIIDPSASSFKQEIERAGRFDVYDAKNDVVEGIRVTDQMLHSGLIKISENCHSVIIEMQQYRWDDKKNDVPIKENDHAMDAMRYMANTVLKYELL